jgi:hypothetical protein
MLGHPSRGARNCRNPWWPLRVMWRNETTPLPMENRPRAIFDRLFGDAGSTDAKARSVYRSVLDAVAQDVRRLRGKLAAADRGKIDQYLEAVRDVERRIQLAEAQGDHDRPQLAGPIGVPPTFSDYYKLMADLLVLAWQTFDRTPRGSAMSVADAMSRPKRQVAIIPESRRRD